MSPMADTPPADTDPPSDWARPLLARQVVLLGQLAEAGVEIALAIRDQVTEAGEAEPRAFLDYARVARAVRLSLLLQERLIKHLEWRDEVGVMRAASAARDDWQAREQLAQARKVQVETIVERIARRDGADDEALERLVAETTERLDQDDLVGDVLARPISDLIALICRDLGLDPDWPRLAEEAWAQDEIAAGHWPFNPPPSGEGDHRRWWRGSSDPQTDDASDAGDPDPTDSGADDPRRMRN
jgi:hypothetical protein